MISGTCSQLPPQLMKTCLLGSNMKGVLEWIEVNFCIDFVWEIGVYEHLFLLCSHFLLSVGTTQNMTSQKSGTNLSSSFSLNFYNYPYTRRGGQLVPKSTSIQVISLVCLVIPWEHPEDQPHIALWKDYRIKKIEEHIKRVKKKSQVTQALCEPWVRVRGSTLKQVATEVSTDLQHQSTCRVDWWMRRAPAQVVENEKTVYTFHFSWTQNTNCVTILAFLPIIICFNTLITT